jgi:uncharacterized protein YdhG (YjbR/CyaY superfamily)
MESKKVKSPYGAIKFTTIDEYHSNQSPEIQEKLNELRTIIREVAKESVETISYNMPAFKLKKVLVYYAANKNHIGFYPTSQPIITFQEELLPYKTSKGAIQFPLDQPFPKDLIQRIVKFRIDVDSIL